MSETARLRGAPGELTWQGRKLQVSRVTFDIEGYFELWLEQQLSNGLERARAQNSSKVYQERLSAANAMLAAGDLAWEGDIARRAATSARGFKELAFYCLAELQPGWTRGEHEQLFESAPARQHLIEIIHQVSAPHPNGLNPAAESRGPTSSPEPSGSPSSPATAD